MKKNKISIKQIAQEAQSGVGTVSRYLNGGYISEEKSRAIKAVVEKYDYQPSYSAQSIRKQNSNVYVLCPSLAGDVNIIVESVIHELYAGDASLNVFIIETTYCPKRYLKICKEVIRRNPRGVILFGINGTLELQTYLSKVEVPIISYEHDWGKIVFITNEQEMMIHLMEWMANDGYLNETRKIYYINEADNAKWTRMLRHNVAETWLQSRHVSIKQIDISDDSKSGVDEVLDDYELNASTIICSSHKIYESIASYCFQKGIDDAIISDIGYDSKIDAFFKPTYRIWMNYSLLGRKIANEMMDAINGYSRVVKKINIVDYEIRKY